MGMSTGGGGGKNPPPEMNITPLIDVALVVLIIFMVMVPTTTKTFWVNLPAKPEPNAPPPPPSNDEPPLILSVRKDGSIWANKTQLDRATIKDKLPRIIAGSTTKQKVVYFDAADDVPFGTAVEALDLLRLAGGKSIAILTKKVVN